MSLLEYNRNAWNKLVAKGDRWTQITSPEMVDKARNGIVEVLLTPTKWVPQSWLGDLKGKKLLGLASGGGQQGPLFAAAGAEVTIFDNSDAQLNQDKIAAEQYGLDIKLVQGNMQDLSAFEDETFDLIFHPCSNCFIDDIKPVWKESARVLKSKGAILSGFCNPIMQSVDPYKYDQGTLEIVHKLPFSDERDLDKEYLAKLKAENTPMEFGHTLSDQIGGQIDAGLLLAGFYEDDFGQTSPFDKYMEIFIATRAVKVQL